MREAISIYRKKFKPSQYLDAPYMIVCLNVIAAETDEEAKREMTTTQQFFLNVVRGTQTFLRPPIENMDNLWSPQEEAVATSMSSMTFIGSKDSVRQQLTEFQEMFHVDEIMAVTYIYDQAKQIRSYEIFKEIVDGR